MTAFVTTTQKIGLVGGVVRGRPPDTCAGTCLKYMTPECAQCQERPIKSVSISFGDEPDINTAILKGLVTPAAVEEFRKQITGG